MKDVEEMAIKFAEMAQEYGMYFFHGIKFAGTQAPYAIQGDQYESDAIDEFGNHYTIFWDTTEMYRKSEEANDYVRRIEEEQEKREYDYLNPEEDNPYDLASYCEDEANACDWDDPVEVLDDEGNSI
jgi:hypothetical protein